MVKDDEVNQASGDHPENGVVNGRTRHSRTSKRAYGSFSSDGALTSGSEVSPTHSRCGSPIPAQRYHSLIDRIHKRIESGDKFFSLEFFPPRTKNAAVNLISLLDRMRNGNPLFVDVTWHPAGNPSSDCETSSMTIATSATNYCDLETMLHMTCISQTKEDLIKNLQRAREIGIRNIMALRGDIPDDGNTKSNFKHAVELVTHIRSLSEDYFSVGVAGYPSGHPEATSYYDDLRHLKAKVDAGADFVVSQLFFKPEIFIQFVKDCREIGITVPIIPGIMPIQSYESLKHIVKLSKLDVPQEIVDKITLLKDNDEAIRNYGICEAVKMAKALFEAGVGPGLHFYTLNREFATTAILKELGLWAEGPRRTLPWKPAAHHKRCCEDVRPIFWSSRPQSYIYRTKDWDEFPNGRWGSSESPAFGEMKDYYMFFMRGKAQPQEQLAMWGESLACEQDVWDIFYCYLTREPNKHGFKVTRTPWNDEELSTETNLLKDQLAIFNKKGVLTINSQPNVFHVSSTDPTVGWGHPGGYVYQKAYLEFFTSRENVESLLRVLPRYPRVTFDIVDRSGIMEFSNCHKHTPNTVTWGVFPGRENIQPTVVDPVSFRVWKDEAFGLWKEKWGTLYPEESKSRDIIQHICETYCLVNLVDNEYHLESCLWKVLDAMFEERLQCDSNKAIRG